MRPECHPRVPLPLPQAGPVPREGIRGRAPKMTACAPPSKDCAPKEINGLGDTGVQIEA